MNDFLQSIRNGNYSKDNGNTGKPRYNNQRPRRSYEPNGNYNRNGNDRKYRPRNNDAHLLDETLSSIKETLSTILSNQETTLSFAERKAVAEERKADAFEFIAHHIGKLTGETFESGQSYPIANDAQGGDQAEVKGVSNADEAQPSVMDSTNDEMGKDDILQLIADMRNEGATYNEIANRLVDLNLPTFSGRGKWHAQTIHRLCQNI